MSYSFPFRKSEDEPAPTRSIVGKVFRILGSTIVLLTAGFFAYMMLAGYVGYFTRHQRSSIRGKILIFGIQGEKGGGRVKLTSYEPRIEYEYQVEGKSYKRNIIAFWGYMRGSKGVAEKVVDRFPPEAKARVYYNPENPEDAVIDRGLKWQPALFLAAGLGFGFWALRIILTNLVREGYARTTGNSLFTRKYTWLDKAALVVGIAVMLPMAFNLIWFE